MHQSRRSFALIITIGLSIFVPPAFAGLSFCEPQLLAITDITAADVRRVDSFVAYAIDGLSLWNGAEWTRVISNDGAVARIVDLHLAAVGLYVRGRDARADELVERIALVIALNGGPPADLETLRREIAETARRPEIERVLAGAAPARTGGPDLARVFTELDATYPDDLVTGPHQLELTRLILQFRDEAIRGPTLAIGAGVATVLLAVERLAHPAELRGHETWMDPAPAGVAYLARHRTTVVSAPFTDRAIAGLRGPKRYAFIAALDVLSRDPPNAWMSKPARVR